VCVVWLWQEAIAEQNRLAARYENDIEIAKAQRDFELKKAAYDQEVQAKKAQSDLAYSLQVFVVAELLRSTPCFKKTMTPWFKK